MFFLNFFFVKKTKPKKKNQYPHQAHASLAASAPVRAIVSFYQFDELVAHAAGEACARGIRHATEVVEKAARQNLTATASDFGCAATADATDFLYVLADVVAFGIQMDSKYHFQGEMCQNFTTFPSKFAYEVYRQYTSFLFGFTNTTCSDWMLTSFNNTKPTPTDYMRPWLWQTCTELGYFQV